MYRLLSLIAAIGGSTFAFAQQPAAVGDSFIKAPQARFSPAAPGRREAAIFAGGCFWGVEGVFDHVKGVVSATSGYTGGDRTTAEYETVSTGTTGHAESVRVVFDPAQVKYADLLRIYFSVVADPTTLNQQGPDSGTQYRSALFPVSPMQEKVARAYLNQLRTQHIFARQIVTSIEMGKSFYPAERYHQNFMALHPTYIPQTLTGIEQLEAMTPADIQALARKYLKPDLAWKAEVTPSKAAS